MRPSLSFPVAFLLALLVLSCAAEDTPNACTLKSGNAASPDGPTGAGPSSCAVPRVTEGCRTTVTVRASGGLTPQVDWDPQCGMNNVVVSAARPDGLSGPVFWSFSAEHGLVGPGLLYGVQPPGTLLESPTRSLQAGTTYRIVLEMIVDGIVIGQGTSTFTP